MQVRFSLPAPYDNYIGRYRKEKYEKKKLDGIGMEGVRYLLDMANVF